jgi:hypothetical protein
MRLKFVLFSKLRDSQSVRCGVLIAATALQYNLLMVTANQREFERVPGLQTLKPNQDYPSTKVTGEDGVYRIIQTKYYSILILKGKRA